MISSSSPQCTYLVFHELHTANGRRALLNSKREFLKLTHLERCCRCQQTPVPRTTGPFPPSLSSPQPHDATGGGICSSLGTFGSSLRASEDVPGLEPAPLTCPSSLASEAFSCLARNLMLLLVGSFWAIDVLILLID